MNMFRSIIIGQKTPIQQKLENYLSVVSYYSSKILSTTYYQQLEKIVKCLSDKEIIRFFQYLLLKIKTLKTLNQYPKLFTLINAFILMNKYDFKVLSQIQKVNLFEFTVNLSKEAWFFGFVKVYSQYLSKLPFVIENQIIFEKNQCESFQIPIQNHINSLFTLVNLVSPLFPTLTTSMNVVLRYQIPGYLLWSQLFERIGKQLLKIYEVLYFIIQNIFANYQSYKKNQIELFINSLADFQTLCDRIEDYVMNKYFKGCKLSRKIGFKQEQVAQVNYYLMKVNSNSSGKSKKSLQKTGISSNIQGKALSCQGQENTSDLGLSVLNMSLKVQSMIIRKKEMDYSQINKENAFIEKFE